MVRQINFCVRNGGVLYLLRQTLIVMNDGVGENKKKQPPERKNLAEGLCKCLNLLHSWLL